MTINNFKSLDELSKQDYLIYDDLAESIGRINNPLLHIPLKNNLDMICGDGTVTFTRSTTATYIDRYGVVQSAAINTPRFEKEGLLIEGASTNKCLQSEDFSNSSWIKSHCTVSSNATTAPDGTTTADEIIEDSTSNTHQIYQHVSSVVGNTTFSVFVKKGERSKLELIVWEGTNGTVFSAAFDLDAVTSTIGKIIKLADNWFYCSVSGTTILTDNYYHIRLLNDNWDSGYQGDGTSGLYLWGAQLEELPFASSYIPTTTAAATRTEEICYADYEENVPAYGPRKEVTIIADYTASTCEQYLSTRCLVRYGNYIRIYLTQNTPQAYIGSQVFFSQNFNDGNTYRIGGIHTSDGTYGYTKVFINGVLDVSSGDSYMENDTLTKIGIGTAYWGDYHIFGHISNLRIYDIALTEKEMRIA